MRNQIERDLHMIEEGQLYSELYLERKEPSEDSQIFRSRLGYYLDTKINSKYQSQIASEFRLRKGVPINSNSMPMGMFYRFEEFLVGCTLVQALDLITISGRTLRENSFREINQFGKFIEDIFCEENLLYKLDKKFGVHPLIDTEFQHAKDATLSALNDSKYVSAKHEFERCYDFISATDPDYKLAVRSVFECAEIIVKDALKSQNLSKYVIEKELSKRIFPIYSGDEVSASVSKLMLVQFVGWVEACHYYRHGQPTDVPLKPPIEIAIHLISAGAANIRWLLDVLPKIENGA